MDSNTLDELVHQSHRQLLGVAADFDDSNCCRQAVNLPNHAAWTIGHVAVTLASVRAAILHERLPVDDFVDSQCDGQCDGHRFSVATVQHGSSPQADAGVYPDWARGLTILAHCVDRFVLIEDLLPRDGSIQWEGQPVGLGSLVVRYSLHMSYHAGQLAALRHALRH